MGGFIPAAPMTVSVAMDVSKNNGIVVVKDAANKNQSKKGGVAAQHSKTSIFPGPPHTGLLFYPCPVIALLPVCHWT